MEEERAAKPVVIGGVVMKTAQDVLDHYTPADERVTAEVWAKVRPLVVKGVSKSRYKAPTSVHFAMRISARFVAWALEQGTPLDPEVIFTPQRVEQYIAEAEANTSYHGQGNYRAALTAVGRAITKRAPWEPEPTPYTQHLRLAAPYTDAEMAGFWDAVEQQSDRGAHILRSLLVFAHGAGLKVGELMDVQASDVFFLRSTPVTSIKVPTRIVPVLTQYTEELRGLCAAVPEGPIIGTQKKKSNDTFANFRKAIKTPSYLPTLAASRLRTTWIKDILNNGASLAEVQAVAGTTSAATLEAIAPFTHRRWADDEYLIIASGARRS